MTFSQKLTVTDGTLKSEYASVIVVNPATQMIRVRYSESLLFPLTLSLTLRLTLTL